MVKEPDSSGFLMLKINLIIKFILRPPFFTYVLSTTKNWITHGNGLQKRFRKKSC